MNITKRISTGAIAGVLLATLGFWTGQHRLEASPAAPAEAHTLPADQRFQLLTQYLQNAQQSAPERLYLASETAAPVVSVLGDCASCHTDDDAVPEDHVPMTGMPLTDCRACHAPHSELSLHGEMPLDHTHGLSGVTCATCHNGAIEEADMEEPDTAICLACHGTLEELGALTADVAPSNPHSSPHGAPFAECSLCHMQHEPSQNFCADCHDFDYDLP